jgi:hypothetical protein
LAYVDVDRILKNQKDELVGVVLPKDEVKEANRVISDIISAFLPSSAG